MTPSRAFLTIGVSVLIFMPGPAGMAHDATGLGTFSTCAAVVMVDGAGGLVSSWPLYMMRNTTAAHHPAPHPQALPAHLRPAPPIPAPRPGTCGSCRRWPGAGGSRTCSHGAPMPRANQAPARAAGFVHAGQCVHARTVCAPGDVHARGVARLQHAEAPGHRDALLVDEDLHGVRRGRGGLGGASRGRRGSSAGRWSGRAGCGEAAQGLRQRPYQLRGATAPSLH
jgi:hypothetical protein